MQGGIATIPGSEQILILFLGLPYIYIHTHIHIHRYVCVHIYIYVYIHTYIHTCFLLAVCIFRNQKTSIYLSLFLSLSLRPFCARARGVVVSVRSELQGFVSRQKTISKRLHR